MSKKKRPTVGQANWGGTLNDHLGNLLREADGGINYLDADPDTNGWGEANVGYTFINTTERAIKRWSANIGGVGDGDYGWQILLQVPGSSTVSGQPSNIFVFGNSETPPEGYSWTGQTQDFGGGNGSWRLGNNTPIPVDTHISGSHNGLIYYFGGNYYTQSRKAYTYNPTNDTYNEIAEAPASLAAMANGHIYKDGKFYLVGGAQRNNGPFAHFNSLYIYDTASNSYSVGANVPGLETAWNSAAIVGDFLYVFGGWRDNSTPALNKAVRYNITNNTWSTITNLPEARYNIGIAVYNNKIYLFGGGTYGGTPHNQVWEYNPDNNTYTNKGKMPISIQCSRCVTINDRIYVIGGTTNANLTFLSNVYEYNPINDSWSTKSPLPNAVYYHSIATHNNEIYSIGGFDRLRHMQIFNPQGSVTYYIHQQN